MLDRIRAAELASLAVEAAPAGVVSEELAGELLEGAGVVSVAIQTKGVRRLLLTAPRMDRAPALVDLRSDNPFERLATPFWTLFLGEGRMLRVVATPRFRTGDFVEVVVSNAPLRTETLAFAARFLGVTVFIAVIAGGLLYLALSVFLVRPIRRITRAMERFRVQPEDPAAVLPPSGRNDEIGRAERELATMQDELRAALQSKARLAALGQAVAKINHDLRNMLTSAQMASDRLAGSVDPRVAQALPRLERALDRAIRLAGDVLTYGKSEEPAPQLQAVDLRAAAEAAAEDAGLSDEGVGFELTLPGGMAVTADPEHLHRILVNLMRNAREAMESREESRHGKVKVSAEWLGQAVVISVADSGPGLADKAKDKLFEPFVGSARPGGTGLGLTIARDLARAQGGDIELAASGPAGARFELTLAGA